MLVVLLDDAVGVLLVREAMDSLALPDRAVLVTLTEAARAAPQAVTAATVRPPPCLPMLVMAVRARLGMLASPVTSWTRRTAAGVVVELAATAARAVVASLAGP